MKWLHWRLIFLLNLPFGVAGLYLVYRNLPDYRAERSDPLDVVGLILFGAGVALLSYVLEVFGEHFLSGAAIAALLVLSLALLFAYGRHAVTTPHPLLRLGLLRLRTLRTAILGSFVTRMGVGGMPFLLPLLFQVGLGYSPVQSGLLILPQSVASMSLRMTMPRLLRRFGYRRVLLSNTLCIGAIIASFALVEPGTSPALIVALEFCFGFFSSFQYTSMNTLVYADVADDDTSMASTIASTSQQLSIELRRGDRVARGRVLHPGSLPRRSDRDHPRHPPRLRDAGRADDPVDAAVPCAERDRRPECESARSLVARELITHPATEAVPIPRASPKREAALGTHTLALIVQLGGGVSTIGLLNDIALATLAAAKLVIRSAAQAGLDLNGTPEVLESIEDMSDRTAQQHLDQVAATLLGDRPEGEILHLKADPRHLSRITEGTAAGTVEGAPLPGRAAHVLGEIMLLLSRSREAVAGDRRAEAYEDLAQVLAMMALAKVLFSLIENEVGNLSVTSDTTDPAAQAK